MGKIGNKVGAFFSNDSTFGKFATRCGIVIAANIMFLLFSVPIVTVGASACGMYRVLLRMFRAGEEINPFKEFWKGFRGSFKQATIFWAIALLLFLIGCMDVYICRAATGVILYLKYVFLALGFLWAILVAYFFPTLASFENTLGRLMQHTVFFAVKNPVKAVAIFLLHAVPIVITYLDEWLKPLFGFFWVFCGFGVIACATAGLLLKEFAPYLPEVDEFGDFIEPEGAADPAGNN